MPIKLIDNVSRIDACTSKLDALVSKAKARSDTTHFKRGHSPEGPLPSLKPSEYRISKIPKGKSGWRLLYCANQAANTRLRQLLPTLEELYAQLDTAQANHGCVPGKSPVTNAFQHIGRRFTLCVDITDFFPSVTESMLATLVPQRLLDACLIDGAPQQGLPTSPLLANIALLPLDQKILLLLDQLKVDATYTRYVDDLSFSFDVAGLEGKILSIVRSVLSSCGLALNEKKTLLQDERNGRRIITGVATDRWGLHPTRRSRRKLRAAVHQKNVSGARGLHEWCSCKLPKMK